MALRLIVEWDTSGSPVAKLYKLYQGDTAKTAVSLPSNVTGTDFLPSFAEQNGRQYIAGTFSEHLVFNEFEELKVAGLNPPAKVPTLAGSGSGTITGTFVPYITYVDKNTAADVVLAESNPVPGDAVTVSGVASLVASNIPTSGGPSRATHVRLYLSFAGGLPRLAAERLIGSSTITTSASVSYLAAQIALPNDGSGGLVFNRNPPPFSYYNEVYHRRMYYAGDPEFPARVWYSELDEPEAVGFNSFFDTRDGEKVTGLHVWNDILVVFCDGATYQIKGWSDGSDGVNPDLNMEKMITGPGCVSHQSIVDINDRLWYADRDGVRIFDGGFRYVSEQIRTFWRDDFATNSDSYFRASAANDDYYNVYMLLIPKTNAFYYIGHYLPTDPVMGGGGRDPWWTVDKRNRKDQSIALFTDSDGTQKVHVGACNGLVYSINDATDSTDASDTLAKQMKLEIHRAYGNSGGDVEDGKTTMKVFSILESESYPWNLSVFGGDEAALDSATSELRTEAVPAGLDTGKIASDVWNHDIEPQTGRNLAFQWTTNTTDGVDGSLKFRGFGVAVEMSGAGKQGAS